MKFRIRPKLPPRGCKRLEHELVGNTCIWRLKQSPHYAGRILKRSFISTIGPTVHTDPRRKRNCSKTLFKPKEFKNAGLALYGKHFENKTLRKWWRHGHHMISLPEICLNTNPKWLAIAVFFYSVLWRSVNGKYLTGFQSKTSWNSSGEVWTGPQQYTVESHS